MLKEGYVNNTNCSYVFIKRSNSRFAIITVYVDDLNIIGALIELSETIAYLKKEFDMKDLGKIKFCLSLQIDHLPEEIFFH